MSSIAAAWSGWSGGPRPCTPMGTGGRARGAGPGLELANRPAVVSGVAGEGAPDAVIGGEQERASVAFGEITTFDQLERLVGQVGQADEVRDRHATPAHPEANVLTGEPELLDEGGAGAGFFDRIEVLARHVLDQRHLE